MIPVVPQPEPLDFDKRVRIPGLTFLATLGRKPTHKDFRKNWYWNRISPELYKAYKGVCAYSANWIPLGTKEASIDHFLPRQNFPDLAYEWSNYRLATARLGNYKDKSLDVIDPFYIKPDWFTLDFATFQVIPNPNLPRYLKNHINRTIEILRLNKDNNLISTRLNVLKDFAEGYSTLNFLERRYPFIAHELKRQGMETKIKKLFSKRPPAS